MHWRLQHVLRTVGPVALLLLSGTAAVALHGTGVGTGHMAHAEVEQVTTASTTTARVRAILVQPGELVDAGETLVLLDDRSIQAELRVARAELAHAGKDADLAEARVALLEGELDATRVIAPASGRVGEIAVHEGAVVKAGSPLVNVVRQDTRRVVVCLDEATAASVSPGDGVTLFPRAGGERREGAVVGLGSSVDPHSQRCTTLRNLTRPGRSAYVLVAGDPLVPGQRFDAQLVDPDRRGPQATLLRLAWRS